MKLIDAEYTFDNNKVLFYFTADGRIDFRAPSTTMPNSIPLAVSTITRSPFFISNCMGSKK